MKFQNPIHDALYKQVVKPAIDRKRMSVDAWVFDVDHVNQTAHVQWKDPQSNNERHHESVPFPVDGDGVFRQSLEEGDYVKLDFRNGKIEAPYITTIYKKKRPVSFQSKHGADIPKGMGFL